MIVSLIVYVMACILELKGSVGSNLSLNWFPTWLNWSERLPLRIEQGEVRRLQAFLSLPPNILQTVLCESEILYINLGFCGVHASPENPDSKVRSLPY